MGACRAALVDDGYQAGILAEGLVGGFRSLRMRFSTGTASEMFGVSWIGLCPKCAKGFGETDGMDPEKERLGSA